jgi:hypothetical protein
MEIDVSEYSDLVQRLRGKKLNCTCAAKSASECCCDTGWPESFCNEAADALEAQAKRIAELEHQMKFECDTYLWNRKRMSRRIALLEYWMERLFKYVSSPEATRNHLTMTTEIPDYLIREGEDILHHLEERSDLEKGG